MNYLVHHGIKGQRWGKQNGPPYPLDPEDRSEREKDLNQKGVRYRKDGGVTISKGTTISRMTKYDESAKKGHAYITYLEHDSEHYKGMFGAKLKEFPLRPNNDVYQVTFKAKEKLVSPGMKEKVNTFGTLYKNDKKFREKLQEYANKYSKKKEIEDYSKMSDKELSGIGYRMFIRALGDSDPYIRSKYFSILQTKGYNFVNDDLDTSLGYGRAPAIVFNTKKSLSYEGQRKVSSNEIYKTFFKRGAKMKDA